MRSLSVAATLLVLLVSLPPVAMQLPPAARTVLMAFAFLMALGGLAFLPLALLLAFSVVSTPDQQDVKRTNVRSATVVVLICLFALGPYVSLTLAWLAGLFD